VDIVASVASIASRRHLLEKVVESLIPQVDRLNVYLNGYDRVPPFCAHKKILHAILSRNAGYRGPEAKLWFADPTQFAAPPRMKADDIHLLCDDDILYPSDYTDRMVAALRERAGSIVCVHGSRFIEPIQTYGTSRRVYGFREALGQDMRVHIAGTGTVAYVVGGMPIQVDRDIRAPNMIDVQFSICAKEWSIPIWALRRAEGWLRYLPPPDGVTIWDQRGGAGNDEIETELVKAASPWT